MWFLKKLNIILLYDPASPKRRRARTLILAYQCSYSHYSQQPEGGNNSDVYQQRNKQKAMCAYTLYFSVIKRNEILILAITLMNPEDTILKK